MTDGLDPMVILADAIEKLAESIDKLALTQARPMSSGGSPGPSPIPATVPPPMAAGGPPGADDSKIRKSKKVYALCAKRVSSGNKAEIASLVAQSGLSATQRNLGADSRQWSEDDINTVLTAMQSWGWDDKHQRAQEPF